MKGAKEIIDFLTKKLADEMLINDEGYNREQFYESLERRQLLNEIIDFITKD